jgi:hypothetical protein
MSKIALDVESVLANTNEAVLQSTDEIDREELLGEWDLSDEMFQVYSGVSDAVWRHNPDSIPPEETMLDQYTAELAEGNTVDIVTARPHVDEQMVWWLDEHNIEYRDFISYEEPKYELEYDVFIDDNPAMFGECRLLLRNQPWNTRCDDRSVKSCDRIYSLAEAIAFV